MVTGDRGGGGSCLGGVRWSFDLFLEDSAPSREFHGHHAAVHTTQASATLGKVATGLVEPSHQLDLWRKDVGQSKLLDLIYYVLCVFFVCLFCFYMIQAFWEESYSQSCVS